MHPVKASGSWDEVVGAHLAFAARVHSPENIRRLGRECGLALVPDGRNTAITYGDVVRYLIAVKTILGETAFVSAKLVAMNKARALGLRPPAERWFI